MADPNTTDLRAAILEVADANAVTKPIAGARVYLSDPQSNRLVTDSVTGDDGAYYLGDVKPGRYVLRIDPKTVTKRYRLLEQERTIEVQPTKEEFMEITLPNLVVVVKNEKTPSDLPPNQTDGKNVKTSPNQASP